MQESRSSTTRAAADAAGQAPEAVLADEMPPVSAWASFEAEAWRAAGPGEPFALTASANVYQGTAGNDRIKGSKGDDILNGGLGADRIKGGSGNDEINGGTSQRAVDDWREGGDIIRAGSGNDIIDGGGGDDVIKSDSGDDYVFGGYGGADRIDGGSGNDRLGGGFAGGYGQRGSDNDILKGGKGQDIFEARFWFDPDRPGYETPMLGPHEDTILDFRSGQDRLDIVVYRDNGAGDFTFRRGGFDLFDSNGDGVLDGRDRFVEVSGSGRKATLTLDVGGALEAAGLIDAVEVDAGPHTLTLKKVSSLDAGDFVSDALYAGLFNPNAGARYEGNGSDEWLVGKDGNDILNGRAGDDLLTGGRGRDVFEISNAGGGSGHDLITDFERGFDELAITGRNGQALRFDMLDTDRNGVLDARDAAVRIEDQQLLAPGITPTVGKSTVIHLDVAFGHATGFTGNNTVTLHGVTGLTGADFRDPALDSHVV